MPKRKTPATTLLDHARRIARQVDEGGLPDFFADAGPASAEDLREVFLDNNGVPRLLATAMLTEALTKRQRASIGRQNGVAIVVEVAQPEMIAPVADALHLAGNFGDILQRSGSQKSLNKPEFGNEKAAALLGKGANVAGISQSPARYLPATLLAAADIRINLGAPSPGAVRSVIALVTGRRARTLPPLAGLTFLDVAAAIRRGATPAACARRLAAMAEAKRTVVATNDAPPLEQTFGMGEAAEWGLALAAAVEEWRRGERSWESIPDKSVVVGGPPGTGKSSFAVSLAKSLRLPLQVTGAGAWFSVGGGYLADVIRAISTTFQEAARNGPMVLFIDEIDSISSRESLDSRHRDYWTPVVNTVLMELYSAASSSSNLIIVGATNHPTRLDPALVRPGRLNRALRMTLPDADAIVGILRQHLGDAVPATDLTPVGTLGMGATGADIAGWAKAAKAAARSANRSVRLDDIVRQVCPPETRAPDIVRTIARHEAAHAVIGEVTETGELEVVTIVERGDFAGRTSARLRNGGTLLTAAQVDAFAMTHLAGRAADEIWGEASSGAGGERWSDLAIATDLLASKAASWGLSGSLLYRGGRSDMQALLSTDDEFRAAVGRDLDRLHARTLRLVRANADRIERVADLLVERRVLGGAIVREIIAGVPANGGAAVEGGPHA